MSQRGISHKGDKAALISCNLSKKKLTLIANQKISYPGNLPQHIGFCLF